jgi:uncharacterized membrane protein
MDALFTQTAHIVAILLQMAAIIIIALGGAEAFARTIIGLIQGKVSQGIRRTIWASFARWLLLGLEFTLAADIISTAIAPTWNDLGQLAVIATVRTFLNYFLERDLAAFRKENA